MKRQPGVANDTTDQKIDLPDCMFILANPYSKSRSVQGYRTLKTIDSKLNHMMTLNRVSVRLIISAFRQQGGISKEQYAEILSALEEMEKEIDELD